MSDIEDILYAPIRDHMAELRAFLKGLRDAPYDAGHRWGISDRYTVYSIAYTLGSHVFGCPDFRHSPDCICEAIREPDMIANLLAGRNLFDGSENASLIRSWFYNGE